MKKPIRAKFDIVALLVGAQIEINGFVGRELDDCIAGLMDKDHHLYTPVFQEKLDKGGLFAGEFWGKWFTAAGRMATRLN